MVFKMKRLIKISVIFLLIIFFSCEKQNLVFNCSDCTENEPITADLKIKLDPSSTELVSINVYEGDIEDNILYKAISTAQSETTVSVTLNKTYTMTAEYHVSGKTYIAMDSVTPGVMYDKNQCDNPCYFVYNKTVNLRLKYN